MASSAARRKGAPHRGGAATRLPDYGGV